MTTMTIFGGSGYAGSHIVEAAVVRGLEVTSITRSESAEQMAGVHYRTGSILDAADRAAALQGADVVIVAVSPRGEMAGQVRPAV
ncbi:NAD(P)H-binding protein, partial [Leucobacter soli]